MPPVPALRRRPSWKFSLFLVVAQKIAHYSIRGTADEQMRIGRFFSGVEEYTFAYLCEYGNCIYVHHSALRQFQSIQMSSHLRVEESWGKKRYGVSTRSNCD